MHSSACLALDGKHTQHKSLPKLLKKEKRKRRRVCEPDFADPNSRLLGPNLRK